MTGVGDVPLGIGFLNEPFIRIENPVKVFVWPKVAVGVWLAT